MGEERLTAEEFERQYAANSGVTVERLRAMGRVVKPCGPEYGCDYEECEGWQSTTEEWWEDDAWKRRPPAVPGGMARARFEGERPS